MPGGPNYRCCLRVLCYRNRTLPAFGRPIIPVQEVGSASRVSALLGPPTPRNDDYLSCIVEHAAICFQSADTASSVPAWSTSGARSAPLGETTVPVSGSTVASANNAVSRERLEDRTDCPGQRGFEIDHPCRAVSKVHPEAVPTGMLGGADIVGRAHGSGSMLTNGSWDLAPVNCQRAVLACRVPMPLREVEDSRLLLRVELGRWCSAAARASRDIRFRRTPSRRSWAMGQPRSRNDMSRWFRESDDGTGRRRCHNGMSPAQMS